MLKSGNGWPEVVTPLNCAQGQRIDDYRRSGLSHTFWEVTKLFLNPPRNQGMIWVLWRIIWQWRRLWNSPASINEFPMLELPSVREPLRSSGPSSFDEGEKTQFCILDGDYDEEFLYSKNKEKARF
jgi:hypothetical protein